MSKQFRKQGIWICFLLLCALFMAIYVGLSVYRGVTPLALRTVSARQLQSNLIQRYGDINDISIEYWFPSNLQVKCYSDIWNDEVVQRVLDDVTDAVAGESFQHSFAEQHDKRYGTTSAFPKVIMFYFYKNGETIPQYRYSCATPFEEYVLIP